ncbi:MAG TPA: hypothetical protein VH475_08265 [Tepidisphaeraceae bacterium]
MQNAIESWIEQDAAERQDARDTRAADEREFADLIIRLASSELNAKATARLVALGKKLGRTPAEAKGMVEATTTYKLAQVVAVTADACAAACSDMELANAQHQQETAAHVASMRLTLKHRVNSSGACIADIDAANSEIARYESDRRVDLEKRNGEALRLRAELDAARTAAETCKSIASNYPTLAERINAANESRELQPA